MSSRKPAKKTARTKTAAKGAVNRAGKGTGKSAS